MNIYIYIYVHKTLKLHKHVLSRTHQKDAGTAQFDDVRFGDGLWTATEGPNWSGEATSIHSFA